MFFTFLRRRNQKPLSLDFLYVLLLKQEEIMVVSYILHKLFEIYTKFQEERKKRERGNTKNNT